MNRNNKEDDLSLARRLRRAGVPLEIPEDDAPISCRSEVGLVMRCIRGLATQLNPYFCSFHILVKIINNRTLPFHISDFDLELPWQPTRLWLLPDPADEIPSRTAYTFWRMDSSSFPRKDVLNHLQNTTFQLKRGRPLQGYLLWMAEGVIPEEFSSKAPMPTMISVIDQYGSPYKTTAPLIIRHLRKTVAIPRTRRNITGRVHGHDPISEPQGTGEASNDELHSDGTNIQEQTDSTVTTTSNSAKPIART